MRSSHVQEASKTGMTLVQYLATLAQGGDGYDIQHDLSDEGRAMVKAYARRMERCLMTQLVDVVMSDDEDDEGEENNEEHDADAK